MTDALTTTGALTGAGLTGITIASFFPGLDLSSVVGAFGGAFFFVLFAKDISAWQRMGYLIVGWIGGYFSAAEMMSLAWTQTSGFSSFAAGLFCVAICISLIETVQTGKAPKWLLFILGRFFGKGRTE